MYIPETIIDINDITEVQNLIHNQKHNQTEKTLLLFLFYITVLCVLMIIVLMYDFIQYNRYQKIASKIYKLAKQNDDLPLKIYYNKKI